MQSPDRWADVAETHTGTVFFLGEIAVKVRKQVRFSFVDLSTRAQRRRACQQEVRLNRRLSPDVYLGVGSIVIPGAEPEPAVMMRRLPSATRLAAMVAAHAPGLDAAVDVLARRLAAFHGSCPVRTDVGRARQLAELWRDATETLAAHPTLVDRALADELARRSDDYLSVHAALFDQRVTDGWVRDGHGDLLADDIFILPDGPRILDCLDFDDKLRCGDVLLDVAFLAMDLERLGAPLLARLLLDRYSSYAEETHPRSLEEFYLAYRAAVRAKVLTLRVDQGDPDAAAEVRACASLAVDHLRAAGVTLLLVGGLPGSGKTTLASTFAAAEPGWIRLSTDVVRKERRLAPGYTPSERSSVYDDMLARAEAALTSGMSVVLDATWGTEEWREHARSVARRTRSPLVEVRCAVDDETARARFDRRRGDASDADEDVRRLLAESFDDWPEATVVETYDVDTATAEVRARVTAAREDGQPATVTNE